MAATGACLWRLPVDASACVGHEPWFWPPLFPLVSGLPVVLGMDPALAALGTATAAMALLTAPLAWLGTRLGGQWGGLAAVSIFLATPALSGHGSHGDARSLLLLALVAGIALAWRTLDGDKGRAGLVGAGMLAGLACLARPEGLLYGGLLCALTAVASGRRAWLPATGFLALILPHFAILSVAAGRPALTSRGWQGAVFDWLHVLPDEWVRLDLAAGAWGEPLRLALSTRSLESGVPDTLAASQMASWLGTVALSAIPPLLGLAAVVGILALARTRSWTGLGLALGLVCATVPVMLMPQAQDPVIPANNALPALTGLVLSGAAALGALVKRLQGSAPPLTAPVLVVSTGLLVAASSALIPRGDTMGLNSHCPVLDEATTWLATNLPEQVIVAASLETAPAVLRARKQRRHLPAPWSAASWSRSETQAQWVLVSHLDMPGAAATLRALDAHGRLQPFHQFGGQEDWALVYAWHPDGP